MAEVVEKKKKVGMFSRLKAEYRMLHKPSAKKLSILTAKVIGGAVLGAAAIACVDAVFNQLFSLFV